MHRRAHVGLVAFSWIVAGSLGCPGGSDETDAGLDAGEDDDDAGIDEDVDAGASDAGPDGGAPNACSDFQSTCEPRPGELPLDAVDRCAVCGRGICVDDGRAEPCVAYPDPHPLCENGEEATLGAATNENGTRPLIFGVLVEIDELAPPACKDGFLWTINMSRVPGPSTVAEIVVDGSAVRTISLTERGPIVRDGDERLVHALDGVVCLPFGSNSLEPTAPRFVVQLVDAEGQRSPRLCGALQLDLPED